MISTLQCTHVLEHAPASRGNSFLVSNNNSIVAATSLSIESAINNLHCLSYYAKCKYILRGLLKYIVADVDADAKHFYENILSVCLCKRSTNELSSLLNECFNEEYLTNMSVVTLQLDNICEQICLNYVRKRQQGIYSFFEGEIDCGDCMVCI